MKFSLSWLKDHLETTADAATIADKLTSIGLEVESVEDSGARLKDFIVAYVISAEKHPNADKLKLCMVDVGTGTPIQVVCGAPNAHTGMKGVFARPARRFAGFFTETPHFCGFCRRSLIRRRPGCRGPSNFSLITVRASAATTACP